jgi:hypothetical protein
MGIEANAYAYHLRHPALSGNTRPVPDPRSS